MNNLVFVYNGDSRSLKKIITGILKSGTAESVKKINYVQNYSLSSKNVEKCEEKIIFILTKDEDKLIEFLSKNYQQLDRLIIN